MSRGPGCLVRGRVPAPCQTTSPGAPRPARPAPPRRPSRLPPWTAAARSARPCSSWPRPRSGSGPRTPSSGASSEVTRRWKKPVKCTPGLQTCSRSPKTGMLQEMRFVRQPSSICNYRVNTMQPSVLWMLGMLIKRQIHKGRFTIAAKHHITIAEVYETELVDIEKAIAHYEQAADYYKGEESNSSANRCLLKVAAYAAQLEQYQKAIEIYEQVGTNTMDNPLLKYSAKEYFFKAALCHFIVDELNAKLALEKYEEMFPAFTDSRECKLVKKLLEAHEDQNCDAYTEAQ
ncbi:beta-soluble NSF attachment protein isoform X3 [Pelodiscus sinensis]|uniref:beta-soluble NSF attachment protein isoform X3 n=1 Tax=Pelodiscus sinensis TaxID=13735 RepID=UPI003F6C546B